MKPPWKILFAFSAAFSPCLCVLGFNIAIWPGDDASVWAPPLNLTNVTAVSGGDGHAMFLRSDGTVVRWAGTFGEEMGVSNAVQIASGWCHDLAVMSNGTVVEWGLVPPNCGSTVPGATSMPSDLTNIVAAAGGHTHSIVLKSDGTCVSWGWMTVSSGYVPAGLSNVTAVAAGFDVSAALKSDGTVANWGYTGYDGTGGNGLSNVTTLVSGQYHCLAIIGNGPQPGDLSIANPNWNSNAFSLSLPTQSGHLYWLEYKNSLDETNWKTLPMSLGNGAMLSLTNSPATNTQRLYRVRQW